VEGARNALLGERRQRAEDGEAGEVVGEEAVEEARVALRQQVENRMAVALRHAGPQRAGAGQCGPQRGHSSPPLLFSSQV
jgi:hypothetical protein